MSVILNIQIEGASFADCLRGLVLDPTDDPRPTPRQGDDPTENFAAPPRVTKPRKRNAEAKAEAIGQQELPTNDTPPAAAAPEAAPVPVVPDVYAHVKAWTAKGNTTAKLVEKLKAFGAARLGEINAEQVPAFLASLEVA